MSEAALRWILGVSCALLCFSFGIVIERGGLTPKKNATGVTRMIVDRAGANAGIPSLQVVMDDKPLCWVGLGPGQVAYLREELAKFPSDPPADQDSGALVRPNGPGAAEVAPDPR